MKGELVEGRDRIENGREDEEEQVHVWAEILLPA